MNLILASQSPRRHEILQNAGIPHSVRTAQVLEEHTPGESASAYVKRLAQSKAAAVARQPGEIVLGADTVVVLNDSILEKPQDRHDAVRMLHGLSGRQHSVVTGICLIADAGQVVDSAETAVFFASIPAAEIEAYAATGEPMDKAGAYAIQGLASKWIDRIEGCYFNVVGLPVSLVYRHLRDLTSAL